MKLKELVAELRRRRVVRVAVAYLLGSWVVIQVATRVFPELELPAWAAKLVVAVALIGLPVALALASAFDRTPEGLQRTDPRDEERAAPSRRPRRGLQRLLAAAVVVIAVVAGAGWYVVEQRTA